MSARLSIRIDLEGACRVGPGKARLLELIDETGSRNATTMPEQSSSRAPGGPHRPSRYSDCAAG